MATPRTMPNRKMGQRTMKKGTNHQGNTIRIVAEKKVDMVELTLDMDDEVFEALAEAGRIEIQNDPNALANYAVSKGLEEFVHANRNR